MDTPGELNLNVVSAAALAVMLVNNGTLGNRMMLLDGRQLVKKVKIFLQNFSKKFELCYNSLSKTQKEIIMKYDGTFKEFVREAMQAAFDGLITGGMKGMETAIHHYINMAVLIGRSGDESRFKQD